ncbi:Non-reducing end alpha-L-arabinofuranosidase [Penicillium ucsense]|uniref:non-reducing end alpha-L-arabinofuranosidase n=1 Tax=Penicillium ucsense TaxID=2839758 RepID=A0A8J8WHV8_9EURO|nr:Non-reducing end alpha-L-arabinofuranosidase [Penicillium ucsense]KAF7736552.1 Non-reducing end alpha-L-arabinofuranosidase [Penicillium ucsense]
MLAQSLLLPLLASYATAVKVSVAGSGGNATTNLQYGAMEEEINHCGEGGLYAELIRNRAFQGSSTFPSTVDAWGAVNGAGLLLQNLTNPLSSALPTSLQVQGEGITGMANSGFWGIDVRPQKYTGSFYVLGSYAGNFTASLQSANGEVFASTEVASESRADEWVQHKFTLHPNKKADNTSNHFVLTFDASQTECGALDFNLISLFPPTWNDRPNGMRRDLMQALQELGPKFLRFPGGNNLEGQTIEGRWKWNETIGPLKDRPGRATTWGYEETSGMGLVEYMEWCDDLEMEPILAVWGGFALNGDAVPESEIGFYVQDALDELEFLTGSTDTKFGALRAKYGHPEPWKIRYVEVGNEDNLNGGLDSYKAYRFPAFYNAISEKYPEIQVIASTINMTFPANAGGDYHTYDIPDNFVSNFNKFDNYTREHPILLGEIAVTEFNNAQHGINWTDKHFTLYPFWLGTVAEAVFLLGAERNADLIIGTTYAPFFENLDSYEWSPTMISFNSNPDQTSKSTSWHLYKLFNDHHMTNTLPSTSDSDFGPLYYATGMNNKTNSYIFKAAVYNSTEEIPISLSFEGVGRGAMADLTILTAPNEVAMNGVDGANIVQTQTKKIKAGKQGVFEFKMPSLSVAVLETK